MYARFSEVCPTTCLQLSSRQDYEKNLSLQFSQLGKCEEDLFLGFFFDGTNNNKYRDTPAFASSNVARLYEVFPGHPTVPQLQLGKVGTPTPDLPPAWPTRVSAEARPYYRKTYVPGVGTPFIELGDSGTGTDETLGLAMAAHGQARIDWALLQVGNHVAAALLGHPMSSPLQDDNLKVIALTGSGMHRKEAAWALRHGIHQLREERLRQLIGVRLKNKPTVRKIRLSVFGFSRGAAEARVFCNWVLRYLGSHYAGLALVIDFLGIFDTVASVGLAHSFPLMDGHFAWATPDDLAIHPAIGRCVHLVAAHEVRGSFPLDAASGENVKEVVYPGVHSDVGGGYPPNDQGRAIGEGRAGDARKLSQIPLAQMYREALIGGVPLLDEAEMIDLRKRMFHVDPATLSAFNAYVEATRQGSGKPEGPLWLVETQPQESLKTIIRRHYGIYLRWRKSMLGQMHQLPGLTQSFDPPHKKAQDINDQKIVDGDLLKELGLMQTMRVSGRDQVLPYPGKRKDWEDGVSQAWYANTPVKPAEKLLFETLVHDSRAWFKPLGADDKLSNLRKYQAQTMREVQDHLDEISLEIRALEERQASQRLLPAQAGRLDELKKERQREQDRLSALQQNKTYVIADGGHEYHWMWGYLRWRMIYSGNHPRSREQKPKPRTSSVNRSARSATSASS
ncbi:DUF2235 domain-containing protein [Herbaspirillum sp. DW155]|uniref:T6SS phospholipase effector Tle1-like catalytic domain-containing protein n=1 Tax=Herbaspirillum sp. DW155 TaxID=3095609 RepID=UPI003088EB24|nr:DUF2235 domain-containing protein [Herbaspirillum sp. DW155]